MKTLSVLASLIILLWLLTVLLRLPHRYVPVLAVWYLGAQAVFTLAGWLGSLQLGFVSRHYAQVYLLTVIPVVLLAFSLICWACWPTMWLVPWGAAVMALTLFHAGKRVIPGVKLEVVQFVAAAFIAVGVAASASLIIERGPVWSRLGAGLAIFWLTQGFFHYHWAVGIVRHREATAMKGYLLPGLIACAIWGWLAISLSTLQGELSREAESIRSMQVPQPANEGR